MKQTQSVTALASLFPFVFSRNCRCIGNAHLALVIESMVVAHTSGSKKRVWRYTEMTKESCSKYCRERIYNRIERKVVHSLNTAAPSSWSQHQECQIIIFSSGNVLEAQGFCFFFLFFKIVFKVHGDISVWGGGVWNLQRMMTMMEMVVGREILWNITAIPESFTLTSGIVFFTMNGNDRAAILAHGGKPDFLIKTFNKHIRKTNRIGNSLTFCFHCTFWFKGDYRPYTFYIWWPWML